MKTKQSTIGKVLYAVCFLILIPMLLLFWAKKTESLILYPTVKAPLGGWILMIAGTLLMLYSMYYLMKYGQGLPMNAFPPRVFVKRGPYKVFKHPIYWGFVVLMIGYFLFQGSASGLWLVTPVTILGLVALVWGYEKLDLKKRFPEESLRTVLTLPEKTHDKADLKDRLASFVWIVGALLLMNYLIRLLTIPEISKINVWPGSDFFQIENGFDILKFMIVFMTPFFISSKEQLYSWAFSGLVALFLSLFIALTLGEGIQLALFETSASLLCPPLYLVFISLWALSRRSAYMKISMSIAALIILWVQWRYLNSALLHFLYSALLFLLAVFSFSIWEVLRRGSEWIANSWREWRYGKVRIINHGFYVGFAAFFAIFTSGFLAGGSYAWALLVFAITVIVFSAVWAQLIEGSEKLKRPYGYYGALVGIIFASMAVWAMGYDVWVIIGSVSVVMPWAQAIGRLRCLVNGCCHGSLTHDASVGIRYFHYRSRVCGLSDLKGELLHPTPLYSIVWLFFTGLVLLSLWVNGLSDPFVFGLYLILTGLGRFVEEAYRGEVQTVILKGLRLYQWTAIGSVLIGIVLTMIHVEPVVRSPEFTWDILWASLIGGLFTTFAMGVDFPDSNARFSRLV